jgi:hypothetical protein
MVRCDINVFVQKRKKPLVPKFDGVQKHGGQRKVIVVKVNVKVRDYYMNSNNWHAKNEQFFVIMHARLVL